MAIAVLDTDTQCPGCGHCGAWSQTLTKQPHMTERFRCEACDLRWSIER